MKSVTIKLISLLLVACMTLPLLVACNGSEDNPKDTTASTTASNDSDTNDPSESETESETELQPAVEKKDYGKEFVAVYDGDTFIEGYYFTTEEDRVPGDPLNDAVYERMLNIKSYLGVDVIGELGGNYIGYSNSFRGAIDAGDDTYPMIMTHVHNDVYGLVTSGYLRDFNDFESIQLDRSYWNLGIMEDLSINDSMYLGYNDFCLAFCYVVAFNKELVGNYKQIGNLYEQVDNKTWTLDKFISYATLGGSENGDEVYDQEDMYGLSCWAWVPLISFQAASGIKIVDRNADGELYIAPMADNSDKITALDEKLNALIAETSTYWYSPYRNQRPGLFVESGHTLFELANIYDFITAAGEDVEVGVLPYPLWDDKQEDYITMSWNGLLGISSAVEDTAMVGDVIEMLAYYSGDTVEAFYENLLGSKSADAPDDARMLKILWDTQQSEFGLHFCEMSSQYLGMHGLLYALPLHTSYTGKAYATLYNEQIDLANKHLTKLFEADFGIEDPADGAE